MSEQPRLPDTGNILQQRSVGEMAHFDEVFANQPYEVLLDASARLFIPDPGTRERTIAHMSPSGPAYTRNPELHTGLDRMRDAHGQYYEAALAGVRQGETLLRAQRTAQLAGARNLFIMLTGQIREGVAPNSYDEFMMLARPERRPVMAERLRTTTYQMLRYYVQQYRINTDRLAAVVVPTVHPAASKPLVPVQSIHTLPTDVAWEHLRTQRPHLDADSLRRIVESASQSPDARRQVVEYFLPSILRRLRYREPEERDELLQLAAERVVRSALWYVRKGKDEPFEPYMSQILSRFLNLAAYSRSVGRVEPFRPDTVLVVQKVANARQRLTHALGRTPSVREVAGELEMPLDEVWPPYSMGLPPEPYIPIEEEIPEDYESPAPLRKLTVQDKILLERAFEFLPAGLTSTIRRHYGFDGQPAMSQAEIAADEGVERYIIKVRLQKARAELGAAIEHMRTGGSYLELQKGRTVRTVLALYDVIGMAVPREVPLDALRMQMGVIILSMPEFDDTDKEVLCKFYGLAGRAQRTRAELVEEYGMKPGRLTDLERKLARIFRPQRKESAE